MRREGVFPRQAVKRWYEGVLGGELVLCCGPVPHMKPLFLVWTKCANPLGPPSSPSQPLKTEWKKKSIHKSFSTCYLSLSLYRTAVTHCVVAAMTQFPLEALYGRKYTVRHVVFEPVNMILLAFSTLIRTDPTLCGPPDT